MHLVDESLKVGGPGSDNSMQWTFFMNPLHMTIWTKVLFQSSNSPFFWPNFSWLVLAQVSPCTWGSCGGSGWWTSGLTPHVEVFHISYCDSVVQLGIWSIQEFVKSSPTNFTTELPENFQSHPFPFHNFTSFRQHLFPHVKNFAGHKPEAAELVPRFAISWFFLHHP